MFVNQFDSRSSVAEKPAELLESLMFIQHAFIDTCNHSRYTTVGDSQFVHTQHVSDAGHEGSPVIIQICKATISLWAEVFEQEILGTYITYAVDTCHIAQLHV